MTEPHAIRKMVGLRIPPRDLAEIKRRASADGLTFTEYMIRSALGRDAGLSERVAALERRLDKLESGG